MKLSFLVALTSCLLSACISTAKMALPFNMSALTEHTVNGANPFAWQKPLAFGRWRTIDTADYGRVDGGVNVGKLVLGGTYHARSLTTNDNINAECSGWLLNIGRKELKLDPSIGNMPLMSCIFSGTANGSFIVKENYANELVGELKTASVNYTIKSEHRYQGSSLLSSSPLGFTIYRHDTPLWSINKVSTGSVLEWQLLPAEQQNLLAALSLILLVTDFESLQWD